MGSTSKVYITPDEFEKKQLDPNRIDHFVRSILKKYSRSKAEEWLASISDDPKLSLAARIGLTGSETTSSDNGDGMGYYDAGFVNYFTMRLPPENGKKPVFKENGILDPDFVKENRRTRRVQINYNPFASDGYTLSVSMGDDDEGRAIIKLLSDKLADTFGVDNYYHKTDLNDDISEVKANLDKAAYQIDRYNSYVYSALPHYNDKFYTPIAAIVGKMPQTHELFNFDGVPTSVAYFEKEGKDTYVDIGNGRKYSVKENFRASTQYIEIGAGEVTDKEVLEDLKSYTSWESRISKIDKALAAKIRDSDPSIHGLNIAMGLTNFGQYIAEYDVENLNLNKSNFVKTISNAMCSDPDRYFGANKETIEHAALLIMQKLELDRRPDFQHAFGAKKKKKPSQSMA